jgi:hypothetical protein
LAINLPPYIIDAGTYSSIDGSRQPSQLELDIAKHQATCVRSPRVSRLQPLACALNHLLVTLLVSPVLLPKAALKHVSPQMLHSRFEPLFSLLYILRQSICSNRDASELQLMLQWLACPKK